MGIVKNYGYGSHGYSRKWENPSVCISAFHGLMFHCNILYSSDSVTSHSFQFYITIVLFSCDETNLNPSWYLFSKYGSKKMNSFD